MIVFESDEKRQYSVYKTNDTEKTKLCDLDLMFSPATNKFDKITEFITDASVVIGPEFEDWFYKFITDYIESGYNYRIVKDNIHTLMELCDKYLVLKDINFKNYIL